MEDYKSLRILSYNRDYNIDEELKKRKNVYNTIFTGFSINPYFQGERINNIEYELFCNPICEIRTLIEEINDNSIEIKNISKEIPNIAKEAIIRKIIVNEIQSTNDIEGVKSTKKELRSAIDSNLEGKSSKFSKIIETYFSILSADNIYLSTIGEVRELYDNLFKGSDTIDEYVEGDLFREDYTYVYKNNKKIHTGVKATILNEKMEDLIVLMNRKDIPFLIKLSICHYIIEYIHPFYDGNGRLGRFLISSYLKRKLDEFSALSISYSINQNKQRYEKLFEEVSHKSNYGELTNFVIGILRLIKEGQDSVKGLIEGSILKLNKIENVIKDMVEKEELDEKTSNVLYVYSQLYAFNEYFYLRDSNIIEMFINNGYKKTEITRILNNLEVRGFLNIISKRPKIHDLSSEMKLRFE